MCSKHAHMHGRLSDMFHPPLIPRHTVCDTCYIYSGCYKAFPLCDTCYIYSGCYNLCMTQWMSEMCIHTTWCLWDISSDVYLRNWSMRVESPSTVRSGDMIRSCKGLLSLARFPSPLDRWITLYTQHRGIDRDVWIHDISTSRSDTRGK